MPAAALAGHPSLGVGGRRLVSSECRDGGERGVGAKRQRCGEEMKKWQVYNVSWISPSTCCSEMSYKSP